MNRREFLAFMTAAGAGTLTPLTGETAARGYTYGTFPLPLWLQRGRESKFFDAATREGYAWARHFLRDVQAGEQGYPTMTLLHMLSWANTWLGIHWKHVPMVVHSGLRVPSTNAATEGAAHASLHLPDPRRIFRASDLHMDGVPVTYLSKLAAVPRAGGVGLYDTHIHVDDGPVRQWRKRPA